MTEPRRSSRADRRKGAVILSPDEDRRNKPSMEVRIHPEIREEEVQLVVCDPITADNCFQAKKTMMALAVRHPGPVVVIDLAKSSYIDTTALAILFDVKKQITQQGRSFFLQDPSRSVLRMLNLTRMNRFFSIRFTANDESGVIRTTEPEV